MTEFLRMISVINLWGRVSIFPAIVAIRDIIFIKKHIILHNFQVVDHLRYFLESIGSKLHQYIFFKNQKQLPFNQICGNKQQLTMDDLKINFGDRFIATTLAQIFLYHKKEVLFDSTLTLVRCTYLGGVYIKEEETNVKEAETEDTSVSKQQTINDRN